MLNILWGALMILSFVCAVITGKMELLSNAVLSGASEGVTLFLTLLGTMCFWNGMLAVAEKAGITRALKKVMRPLLSRIFPDAFCDEKTADAISVNLAANVLGIGNAATPSGLAAMQEMQKRNIDRETASDDMVTFVVLNSASIQLLPTTVAALRASHGSANPMEIMPAVWISSLTSAVFGVALCLLISHGRGKR